MRTLIFLIFSLLGGYYSFEQCALQANIKRNNSQCTDTLTVMYASGAKSIVWLKEDSILKIVNAVTVFNSNNLAITVAGGNGAGNAANQLTNPTSIFVDATGNLFVADYGNYRVQKFPAGSTAATNGITVAGGNGQGPGANQLDDPLAVFVDAAGSLYISDHSNNRIQKFSPNSTSTTNGITVAGGNGFGNAANQLNGPGYFYIDASGNLIIPDYVNKRIQQFPPGSGSATNGLTIASDLSTSPESVAIESNGNLYVSDPNGNRILEFAKGSNSFTTLTSQVAMPMGIFLNPVNSYLYVADAGNNRVQLFTSGSANGIIVAGGNGSGIASNQLNNPFGVFVDAQGNIFVADNGNNRIQKFSYYINTIDSIYIPASPGIYRAVVTNNTGCTDTSNAITIETSAISALSIRANTTTICDGDTVLFTAIPVNGGTDPQYQWGINGKDAGINSDMFLSASMQDLDVVSCVMKIGNNCATLVSSKDSITMTVKPKPQIIFNPDTVIIKPGTTTVLDPIITGNAMYYKWTPSTALDNPYIPDPAANPSVNSVYRLDASNEDCITSASIAILVNWPLQMPSAFTPNGDGKNDLFRIPFSSDADLKHFSVYNRNGQTVFETNTISKGWDGTFKGGQQPSGTYIWVIEYIDRLTRKTSISSGTVVLIR